MLSSNTIGDVVSETLTVEGCEQLTECQFFEGAAAGLGVQEIDDAELEEDPAAVDGKVLPRDGGKGDRVDVGREETGQLAEDLLNTDATAAVSVRPELDQVRCSMLATPFCCNSQR